MYDLICDVISFCDWSCELGKSNASDKVMIESQKKEKMKIKEILHKSQSKRWVLVTNGIYAACIYRRADARSSDVFRRMYFVYMHVLPMCWWIKIDIYVTHIAIVCGLGI